MTKEKELQHELGEICLLDFHPGEVEKILSDPSLAKKLSDFDHSSALEHIDEYINLCEAPEIGYLSADAVLEIRKIWTVRIPQDTAAKIEQFLKREDPI